MFFVSMLLNDLIAWMRAQQGTSSLRAILYMDEIFRLHASGRESAIEEPVLSLY